jgi:hypothetical protein
VALFDAYMVHYSNDVLIEYDVTADGKRFLINTASGPGAAASAPDRGDELEEVNCTAGDLVTGALAVALTVFAVGVYFETPK